MVELKWIIFFGIIKEVDYMRRRWTHWVIVFEIEEAANELWICGYGIGDPGDGRVIEASDSSITRVKKTLTIPTQTPLFN